MSCTSRKPARTAAVLCCGSRRPRQIRLAVEAALRVARAYQSELESIFIEDQQLVDLCAHPDVHEVSLCGRERRELSPVTLIRQFAYRRATGGAAVSRAMAARAEIPYRARTIRDEPVHALNRACAEAGPWNVVALAEPVETARPRDRATAARRDRRGDWHRAGRPGGAPHRWAGRRRRRGHRAVCR